MTFFSCTISLKRHFIFPWIFLWGGIFLSLLPSFLESAPQTGGLNINGAPKYPANFTHFAYTSPKAKKGGTLKLAVPGTFDSLNPFIITGIPGAGSDLLFPMLMTRSEDELASMYPYVAESWELGKDGKSITFTLRKEATFHDHTPITPEDVIFSFEILLQKGNPMFGNLFADIKKVEKVADRGVKFIFSEKPNRELPFIVGVNLPIFSKKFYSAHDFSKPSLLPPLGGGPYAYKTIEPGRSITLSRVQNWWGENLPVNKYMYNFDALKMEYFRDPNVAFEAFKLGEIDFRQEISAKIWATGYDLPAVKKGLILLKEVEHSLPLGMIGYIFNTRKSFLKDPRVREALSYAFDFEWLNKNIFYGSYTRHKSYFSNSPFASKGLPSEQELKILAPFKDALPARLFTEAFSLPTTDGSGNIRENIKKAHKLLKDAGYVVQDGKLLFKETGKPLKLELISNNPSTEKITLHFIKNLQALGVEASLRMLDASQYTERTNSFDYDVIAGALLPQSNNPGNEQRDYWSCESCKTPGSFNLVGVCDPVIDQLIEKVIASPNYEQLVDTVHALDRVLLWNFYLIPNWSLDKFRYAYWDKFGFPETSPLYTVGVYTWWIDPELEEKLQKYLKKGF